MGFIIKEKGGVNADVFIEFLKRLMVGATHPIYLNRRSRPAVWTDANAVTDRQNHPLTVNLFRAQNSYARPRSPILTSSA